MLQRVQIPFQILRFERFSVRRADQLRIPADDRFPGFPELLRVFDPDGRPSAAGKAVHRRVAAKQHVFCEKRDMVCRMAGSFQHLIGEIQRAEPFGTNRNEPVQVFLPDGGISMIAVAEQGQDLAEDSGQV